MDFKNLRSNSSEIVINKPEFLIKFPELLIKQHQKTQEIKEFDNQVVQAHTNLGILLIFKRGTENGKQEVINEKDTRNSSIKT